MAQITSGQVLKEARERKDYDLNTIARRLRIRPDILRAIESGDFSSMPPRGYTRNMVNAYARLLGLNPTEIVDMYLDEAYANQVERARSSARGSGFNMEPERRPRFTGRIDTYQADNRAEDDVRNSDPADMYRTRTRNRQLYDDRTRYSRDDYGVTRERVERPGRSERDFLSHHSGYGESDYSNMPDTRRRSRRGDVHVGQTPMEYKAPRFAALRNRWVLIVAIILVVLVIIAIVSFIGGGSQKTNENDVSKLPVSGITDTTGTADDDVGSPQVEIAPTSARVIMKVPDGKDCYIETYLDGGSAEPAILNGPTEKTVEVTGKWVLTTFAKDNITVTVNGETKDFELNDDYAGMYSLTVDFPALLEEWKSTHTSKDNTRQAAVAEAESAKQQAEAASSSSSSSASSSSASASKSSVSSSEDESEEEEEY